MPGLAHGLTHAFPAPGVLAAADLTGAGLPAALASTVRDFAAAVEAGEVVLDGSVEDETLIGMLTGIPGYGPAAARQLAERIGGPVVARTTSE